MLVAAEKPAPADEEAAAAQLQAYAAWLQSAQVADAKADIHELRAQATALLDTQLSKTSEQVRKDTEASMQQVSGSACSIQPHRLCVGPLACRLGSFTTTFVGLGVTRCALEHKSRPFSCCVAWVA